MEPKFKTGDVVELKSGSNQMTVGEYDKNGHVICQWFDKEKGKIEKHTFHEDELKPYKRKSDFGLNAIG
jgi:uncharacterized protein YodC (DUF2158 family)